MLVLLRKGNLNNIIAIILITRISTVLFLFYPQRIFQQHYELYVVTRLTFVFKPQFSLSLQCFVNVHKGNLQFVSHEAEGWLPWTQVPPSSSNVVQCRGSQPTFRRDIWSQYLVAQSNTSKKSACKWPLQPQYNVHIRKSKSVSELFGRPCLRNLFPSPEKVSRGTHA
jgi:hypothetical protein